MHIIGPISEISITKIWRWEHQISPKLFPARSKAVEHNIDGTP